MLPAAAAAMKHFLDLYEGQVYWFAPCIQRQHPAHQLWPMSSLFLLDVYGSNPFLLDRYQTASVQCPF